MNTVEEIQTALGELVAAMTEKGVQLPDAKFSIRPDSINVYLTGPDKGFYIGKTPAEAIEKARAYIAALPSPEEVGVREFLGSLSDTMEIGRKHSLPDEYVAPLRGVSTAMTENLLTKGPTT